MAEEKTEAAAESAPKMGKSNMVLVIIIAVLSTILVGGGVGAFFLMRGGKHEETADAPAEAASAGETAKEESADKKKDKGKKDSAPKGPAIYVGLEPPFVVNFDANQNVRFLQVTVQLMTRDSATAQLLKENDPVIRNDLLLLFGNQDATVLGSREGKESLRKQALDTVRAIIKAESGKPDSLEAVYFTTFVMQ